MIMFPAELAPILNGRRPREGYERGVGLKHGELARVISGEEDFQEAYALAQGRTLMGDLKVYNLYLLVRYYLPKIEPGLIVEFGCFRGGSAMFMAKLAARYLPETTIIGMDTFEGLPAGDAIDLHKGGDFANTDFAEVEAARQTAGLDNLRFVKGRFENTFAAAVREPIALAHIDCDIYPACSFAYDAVKPLMVSSGYIVFDDATESTCLGATEVVESLVVARDGLRSEQIDPHYVFRYPPLAG